MIIESIKKLDTVQTQEKLNDVYSVSGYNEPGGAPHRYIVIRANEDIEDENKYIAQIIYQKGPRTEEDSITGVLDCDLLEMVKDRLEAFQEGPYSCWQNEKALLHVKEALYWMNKRVEDRISRDVLGKNEK